MATDRLAPHAELVERIVTAVAQRHCFDAATADDFRGYVHAKLLNNDCAILKRFEGRSSWATYLTVVITNLLRDFIRGHGTGEGAGGRWRPSVAARKLGEVAEQLEKLMYWDGYPFFEAVAVLRSRFRVHDSDHELARVASQLPRRTRVRAVSADYLELIPAEDSADHSIIEEEAAAARGSIECAVEQALRSLPPDDQLVLRMHFWSGMSWANIERALQLEPKSLYRRKEQLNAALRLKLAEQGINAATFLEAMEMQA